MLIWGRSDRLVPISGAQRVLRAVPGSRLFALQGIGHCAQVEDPVRIAALVTDFVAQCEALTAVKEG
jgi:pimeloyl-ACP methyl ester carboxylesterase